jgi:hypothetical protein
MRKTMLAALMLFAGALTPALAADLCWYSNGGGSMVVKDWRWPGKNKCVPFNGFEPVSLGGVFTGSACTDSTGWNTIVHYAFHSHSLNSSYFETGDCRIQLTNDRPSRGAQCYGTYIATPGGTGRFFDSATLHQCTVDVPH